MRDWKNSISPKKARKDLRTQSGWKFFQYVALRGQMRYWKNSISPKKARKDLQTQSGWKFFQYRGLRRADAVLE